LHPDDPTIATHVKIALLNDSAVGGLRIQAVSAAGVVTLTGEVGSLEQVARAVQVARGVDGVRDVRAELVVRPPTARS
jgi:hyperosmotically inducible protein